MSYNGTRYEEWRVSTTSSSLELDLVSGVSPRPKLIVCCRFVRRLDLCRLTLQILRAPPPALGRRPPTGIWCTPHWGAARPRGSGAPRTGAPPAHGDLVHPALGCRPPTGIWCTPAQFVLPVSMCIQESDNPDSLCKEGIGFARAEVSNYTSEFLIP